jgi:hypothetical protein
VVVAGGPGVKKCSDIGGAEGEFKDKRSVGVLADSINLEARSAWGNCGRCSTQLDFEEVMDLLP